MYSYIKGNIEDLIEEAAKEVNEENISSNY